MTLSLTPADLKRLAEVFRMPSVQTMVSRKSSVTNAFVNSVIPVVTPTPPEIAEALSILGIHWNDLRCAYCGDPATEWDHLRALVMNRRPTGYISEIANLIPSCGKCNQSKGNKHWREWMVSGAKRSPTGRQKPDVAERVARIEAFEQWRSPTQVDFERILGRDAWEHYWSLCESVNAEMRDAQTVADALRTKVIDAIKVKTDRK